MNRVNNNNKQIISYIVSISEIVNIIRLTEYRDFDFSLVFTVRIYSLYFPYPGIFSHAVGNTEFRIVIDVDNFDIPAALNRLIRVIPRDLWRRFTTNIHVIFDWLASTDRDRFQVRTIDSWFHCRNKRRKDSIKTRTRICMQL